MNETEAKQIFDSAQKNFIEKKFNDARKLWLQLLPKNWTFTLL